MVLDRREGGGVWATGWKPRDGSRPPVAENRVDPGEGERHVLRSADGIFSKHALNGLHGPCARNRPTVVDSPRNRAESESRKFPFDIKSEKF